MRRVVDQRESNWKRSSLGRLARFLNGDFGRQFFTPAQQNWRRHFLKKPTAFRLLYRNALGQIARFVYVATENHREMVGEKLERDRGENRHNNVRRGRHRKNVVGD